MILRTVKESIPLKKKISSLLTKYYFLINETT